MAIFINIACDEQAITPDAARKLAATCPVDIFAVQEPEARLIIRDEQLDECTLCELCLNLAPSGALTIHKLYKDEHLAR